MSTTSAPRLIVVDDTDLSINYTGPWNYSQGSLETVGNFGPPYQNTLHIVNSNASLSYAFNGSQILVYGSNSSKNTTDVLDPTWDCIVDGISIGSTPAYYNAENNWVFCNNTGLVDGPHVLTFNVTILNGDTFWFDFIRYLPSASVPLDHAAIYVDNLDSQLQYGTGWEPLDGIADMTNVAGSVVNFDFIGVSLSWYGLIPAEFPFNPSEATYSIDGEAPITFQLNGLPANATTTFYNQKFFEIVQLSPASHTLEVTYVGTDSMPLNLDYLIIQNGTPSFSTIVSLLPTSTGNITSATSTSTAKSTPDNSIVGGVIGGLALVVFAILGFFLLRRREKRDIQETSTPQPGYTPLSPSSPTPNPSSGGSAYFQVPQTAQLGSRVTGPRGPGSGPDPTGPGQSLDGSDLCQGVQGQ